MALQEEIYENGEMNLYGNPVYTISEKAASPKKWALQRN